MKYKIYIIVIPVLILTIGSCLAQDNQRLMYLAEQDQSDRKQNNLEVSKNDRTRLNEVKSIFILGGVNTSKDFFNAALIFQHGDNPEDYKKANDLAQKAVELDPENKDARFMIAQSMDRYLLSINKPQIYGTQRRVFGELQYLQSIDTSAVTDDERKELGAYTLNELLRFFNEMHKKSETNILQYVPSDSLYRVYYPEKRADLIGTFDELLSKIEYPDSALENNISGKVLIQYTISPTGETKNIIVVEGIGYGCDEEAKRIMEIAKFKNYLNRDIERRTRIPFEIKNNANRVGGREP
ncbi:energy transducer TonB [Flammeovirgaceae bacterium SG7u.111]|nr:energy transducer TonB [Flammeovirgaceae bacterium SG7u.132]WPO37801.1 energy transducer TonB [Flammeovirgaceae bacterium SG7u.111]